MIETITQTSYRVECDYPGCTAKRTLKAKTNRLSWPWISICRTTTRLDQARVTHYCGVTHASASLGDKFETVRIETDGVDLLETVFLNGDIVKRYTFEEVRNVSNQ